ncbi:MAG: acyltransferase family protein [Planctomycetaceae bacterium]|nr:acyltransferase family protein [Planctomycetaceae bacterium]
MDNLKGVLIFLVVFSHFLLHYVQEGVASLFVQTLTYYIFTFHMPLFVFVSGYFSKNVEKSRVNAFESLLLPYLVFNSLMMFCEARATGSMRHVSLLTPVYVHWFLLALFFWRILLKDLVKIRLILPISVFAALMVGYFNDGTNILGIGRTIAFLPFFLFGYYTDESMIAKMRTTNRYLAVALLVASAWPVYLLTASHSLSLSVFVAAPYAPTGTLWLRLAFFALAFLIGLAVLVLCPAAKLKFLTSAGRFSLLVFLLHRYVNFLFYDLVPAEAWRSAHVLTVFALSALTVWLLGNPVMAGAYSAVAACARNLLTTGRYRPTADGKPARDLLAALVLFALPTVYVALSDASTASENQGDVIHAVLDREQRREIDSAATVSFVGDLILLEDQVKRAWDDESESFDFRPVFEHTRDYFQKADFSVGVLEVPLAGEEAGYSTSNFGDGIPLRLNGPDRWVQDIQGSGIDLVTTATNHAMDKGKAGLYRTLDVLDRIGLAHIGTGRDTAERNRILIRNVKGIKIAFLAYTYGANFCDPAYFDGDNAHLLTVLAPPENRREFTQSLKIVRQDIRRAMLHDPDVIIALPHMGEQFSHSSDRFSRVWAKALLEEGVDIVLAAHAHAVQPIEYHSIPTPDGGQRKGLVVYCPGNFVNEYTEKDGDAAAIVNVHLDTAPEQRGRLLGVSLVPLWIQRRIAGQPRPVPVYATVADPELRAEISGLEWKRIEEVHRIVTKVMLGTPLTIDQVQERYYYLPDCGYARVPLETRLARDIDPEELDAERRRFYEALAESKRTVMLGDSITAGSKNGGYGWFEPIMGLFPENQFVNRGVGGETTETLLDHLDRDVAEPADLFVVAVGANDVRYRDPAICTMTPDAFARNLERIAAKIRAAQPDARIAFVNVWLAYDNDRFSRLPPEKRDAMVAEYNRVLRDVCTDGGYIFLDANQHIRAYLERHVTDDNILDHIHPNAGRGIRLYSNAVLFGPPARWAVE